MTESLLQIATALSASTALSIVVKASLALGLAMLAVRCARRARASTRHLILASTFAALVALPLTAVFAPPITVAVPRPPLMSQAVMVSTVIADLPAQAGMAADGDAGVVPNSRSSLSPSTTMVNLAGLLSSRVGRIVEDRTGLTGLFDFDFEFAPESAGAPAAGAGANAAPAASDRPSLFTAIEEQLGLRLQPQRAPVDVLVIDRLDPPTEN